MSLSVPGAKIKSVQRGTLVVASSSGTASITAVTMAKAELEFMGWTVPATAAATLIDDVLCRMELTATDEITVTRKSTAPDPTVGFEVTEWV